MELYLIVASVFFIAFFIESIFGFGGLLISFTVLSFFVDIKELIYLGLYVGTCASIFVLMTDYKSLLLRDYYRIFPIALLGTIIGVFVFNYFSDVILLKLFAVFLFVFSIKSLFYDSYKLGNKIMKKVTLFIGGITQGLFGTGGPFTIMAVKDDFKKKGNLRSTMALFFISFNIIRAIQLQFMGSFEYGYIINYWWIVFVLFASIILGYLVHVRIKETTFRMGINYLLLFASIVLFLK